MKTVKNTCKAGMMELINSTNIMADDQEMIDGVVEALLESHRTLQQSTMRILKSAFVEYAKKARTDLRNESGVEFARLSGEIDIHLPLV